jgi:hypothetical protein
LNQLLRSFLCFLRQARRGSFSAVPCFNHLLFFLSFNRSRKVLEFHLLTTVRGQERHMHCALHIIGSMTDSWNMKRLYIEGVAA